jgi:hypothetical protein
MTIYSEIVVSLMSPSSAMVQALSHCADLFTGERPAKRIAYELLSSSDPDDHDRLVVVNFEKGMTANMSVRVFADAALLLLEGEGGRFALIGLDDEDAEAMLREPVEVCVLDPDSGDALFSLDGALADRTRKTAL